MALDDCASRSRTWRRSTAAISARRAGWSASAAPADRRRHSGREHRETLRHGATAFREGWMAIKAGVYDTVLAVASRRWRRTPRRAGGGTGIRRKACSAR